MRPRDPSEVNPYVRSELDKATDTWGIPNHLARTMACHPMLALTEIDYANSFIFKENEFVEIPRPGKTGDGNVLFPSAGFVDRITKELVINFVSLINRSRYSITHHGFISWSVLSTVVAGANDRRGRRAPSRCFFTWSTNGARRPTARRRRSRASRSIRRCRSRL